jgi:V8-like Glu-specific endopeptidase
MVMAKQPPPATAGAVQRRAGVKATEAFPDARIELSRVWVSGRREFEVEARRVKGRRAAVALEAASNLTGRIVEPPAITAEKLTARLARQAATEDERATAGLYPAHLPLSYKPMLVEKLRTRRIRDGSDLPNSVFAPDSRYIFQDTAFPWCTTGRVDTSGGGCTGTVVGRRLMVTGSHCMQWTDTGAGWVKFTPSYYNGSAPFGVAGGTRVIYWSRVDGSDGVSDQETAFDYVVIVLDRSMGDLTGYVGYRTYSDSWNGGKYWQQIGHPGDLSGGQRPAFSGGGDRDSRAAHHQRQKRLRPRSLHRHLARPLGQPAAARQRHPRRQRSRRGSRFIEPDRIRATELPVTAASLSPDWPFAQGLRVVHPLSRLRDRHPRARHRRPSEANIGTFVNSASIENRDLDVWYGAQVTNDITADPPKTGTPADPTSSPSAGSCRPA